MQRKLGEEAKIKFWQHKWTEHRAFWNTFSRLYRNSSQQNYRVSKMGKWIREDWILDMKWKRTWFCQEKIIMPSLMEKINHYFQKGGARHMDMGRRKQRRIHIRKVYELLHNYGNNEENIYSYTCGLYHQKFVRFM